MSQAVADTLTVEVDGLEIAYRHAGDGDALICLHGGGPGASGWSNYHRNIEPFSRHFSTYAIDLPCFGASTKLKLQEPRIAFFARVTRGFMDAVGIERAHFVGNSLGGATTMRLAIDTPERAGKLVLMAPAVSLDLLTPMPSEGIKQMMGYYSGEGPTQEKMRRFVEIMVADRAKVTDELVETRYQMSIDPDILANPLGPPSAESPFEAMWPEACKLVHETLLVWGREDRVIPVDSALFLMAQIRQATLHVMPDCGHWVQWEQTDRFNRLVIDFLAR